MTRLRLPRFQYTVREVVSGLSLVGYADELSKSYTTLLAEQVSAPLAWHGVDLHRVVWQTDNGSEFLQGRDPRGLPAAVRALGSDHRDIPPKAYTWQSDVETVHRLVQDEFFDRENFASPTEFWAKATTYGYYFNLARLNRGKEWQTPLQITSGAVAATSTQPSPVGAVLTSAHFIANTSPITPKGVTIYPSIPKTGSL